MTELVGKNLDMKNSGTSLLEGEGVGNLEVIHSPAEERLIWLNFPKFPKLNYSGYWVTAPAWRSDQGGHFRKVRV